MPHGVKELFECWKTSFGKSSKWTIWEAVPHCLLWCLWRERNDRCFEGRERHMLDLKALFLFTLLDWMVVTGLYSVTTTLDILDLCIA
jgi:hypothetical protein